MVSAIMITTHDAIGIGIFAKSCCIFSGTVYAVQTLAALSQHIVGLLPNFLADQWRHTNGIIMQLPLVPRNGDVFILTIVRFIGFPVDDIPKINRVAYHSFNGGWVIGITCIIQKALLYQQFRNTAGTQFTFCVFLKYKADKLCLLLIHIVSVVFIIKAVSDGRRCTVALTILHGLPITKLYPLRCLAAFFLGNNGHDGKTKFRILVHGVKIDILNQYTHIITQQFPHRLHTVHDIPCKSGNLFCQDQIKCPCFCIPHHFQKLRALVGTGASNALIDITGNILPLLTALDFTLKISDLMFQRVELLIFIRTDTAIECHPQGNIIDSLSTKQRRSDFFYIFVHMSLRCMLVS